VGWAFQEQYAPGGGNFLQGREQGNKGTRGQEIKDLAEAERAGPTPGLDGEWGGSASEEPKRCAREARGSGGGLAELCSRFPEAQFGFAAGLEPEIDCAGGQIPEQELLGGGIVAAGVEGAQQGGLGQAAGAEIEAKVDEGVELALGQGHRNEAADGALGLGNVAGQEGGGLRFRDAGGKGLGRHDAMAVADGRKAGYIVVGVVAKAFESLDQIEPFGAQFHGICPFAAETRKGLPGTLPGKPYIHSS